MNTMHHAGYDAVVAYDEDAEVFHGEVINLRDVVTFEGVSVDDLKSAFAGSVSDYLAFCKQRGEPPEKCVFGPVPGSCRASPAQGRRHRRQTGWLEFEQVDSDDLGARRRLRRIAIASWASALVPDTD